VGAGDVLNKQKTRKEGREGKVMENIVRELE
jgi:hypothetical protein